MNDRRSTCEQAGMTFEEELQNEFALGISTIESGETITGADTFNKEAGRYGSLL